MGVAAARLRPPPAGIASLAERYDPDVIDVPGGRALVRLRVRGGEEWDARISGRRLRIVPARDDSEPDAVIAADARDLAAHRRRTCAAGWPPSSAGACACAAACTSGVGFLAATSGSDEPGRLRFETLRTRSGRISILSAGRRAPTRCSACTAWAAPRPRSCRPSPRWPTRYRVVAMDLPGFGESDKPIGAPYDAAWFARSGLRHARRAGRRARRTWSGTAWAAAWRSRPGLQQRDRVRGLVLLSPALAWLRDRRWAPLVRLLRPELGLLQVTPRPVVERVVRRLVPGGGTRLGGGGRGRVPARLPDPARARRLLRRRAQHLPRRAARRRRLLDPPGRRSRPTRCSSGAGTTRSCRSPS